MCVASQFVPSTLCCVNDSDAPAGSRSRGWRAAAATLLWLECAALVAGATVYLVYAIAGDSADRAFPLSLAALALVLAVAVGAAARGVWRERRWASSLSITWQVMQAAIGISAFVSRPTVGVVVIAVSLAALVVTMRAVPRPLAPPAE
jgi:uncharacterized membrane protein YoaK (UPF0700 family)